MKTENYKSLSLSLKIYGIQPIDLALGCGLLFVLNVVSAPISVMALAALVLFVLGRRAAGRATGFFTSLGLFVAAPILSGVKAQDVKSYRQTLEDKNV